MYLEVEFNFINILLRFEAILILKNGDLSTAKNTKFLFLLFLNNCLAKIGWSGVIAEVQMVV